MKAEKDAAVVSHPFESLSRNITVQVKNVTQNQSDNDITFLNVKIHDDLGKILEVLGEEGIVGFLSYNGKLI